MNWLNSLASRFVLASLVLLPLLIGLSGYMLDQAFQRSLITAEHDRLNSQVYLLLGALEIVDGQPQLPEQLHEPKFSQTDSGLYGWVFTRSQLQWQSPSVLFPTPVELDGTNIKGGQSEYKVMGVGNLGRVFSLSFDAEWELHDVTLPLRIYVWHDSSNYDGELSSYRQQLWQWLGSLGLGFLIAQLLIMRWGLQPLNRLKGDLDKLKDQQEPQLPSGYPAEIQPVTNSLNQVLASQQRQNERYKNTLGDLAHSLKTPLAVISGFAQQDPELQKKLQEPLQRMDEIVSHQLARASLGSKGNLNNAVSLQPLCQRLLGALEKVYRRSSGDFLLDIPPNCMVQGDDSDFMEMLGNLLDNACKYGRRQLIISAEQRGKSWFLYIEDDGPGVPELKRATILERGQRADTATAGQGIGLAVVIDIISAYGGSLQIDRSDRLGGACFTLSLNAV